MGFIDSFFDGINEDNSDGNSEGFPVPTADDVSLGFFEMSMLGLADSSKLGEELRFREDVWLGATLGPCNLGP